MELVVLINRPDGVAVMDFSTKTLRESVIEWLSSKHKKDYLVSVSDEELFNLPKEYELDAFLDSYIEKAVQRTVPDYTDFTRVQRESLPDVDFMKAWNFGTEITVDMDKAREIHMDRIRLKRAKKFNELGVPYKLHPSLEEAVLPVELRNKLKALREIPEKFDLSKASTLDELKTLWPEELK